MRQLLTEDPPPLYNSTHIIGGCYRHSTGRLIPADIADACLKAISKEPVNRFQTVAELAQIIRDWLQGAKQRESALAIVERAKNSEAQAIELEGRAKELRLEGESLLQSIPNWESETAKHVAWSKLDQAKALEDQAEICRIEEEQQLQGALTHKADLLEAHLALAAYYWRQHHKTESHRNPQLAATLQVKLNHHVQSLPVKHPQRVTFEQYISGQGRLSLDTVPTGASVFLERYTTINRRLVAEPLKTLGQTPLDNISLDMGSYRLRITKEGFEDTLYPVSITREGTWNDTIPAQISPHLTLQPKGA